MFGFVTPDVGLDVNYKAIKKKNRTEVVESNILT